MAISYGDIRGKQPGIKGAQISKTAGIRPYKLDLLYRYAYDDMKGGEVTGNKLGGLASSTTDGHVQVFKTARGLSYDKLNINTQATDPLPKQNAAGLDLSSVAQTDARGAEYIFGGLTNPMLGFVVGTDEFFMRAQVKVHVFQYTDLWIGFRKNTAFVANQAAWGTAVPVATYGDLASIFLQHVSAGVGKTNTQTSLNGAAAVTTDLSLARADDDIVLVEIRVDKGGNATYLVNGAKPSAAPAFQFTSGITVVPMIAFMNNGGAGAGVYQSQIECGLSAGNVRAG